MKGSHQVIVSRTTTHCYGADSLEHALALACVQSADSNTTVEVHTPSGEVYLITAERHTP